MAKRSWMKKVIFGGLIFLGTLSPGKSPVGSASCMLDLTLDLPDAWEYIDREEKRTDRSWEDATLPWLAGGDAGGAICLQSAGSKFEYPLVLMVDKGWKHDVPVPSFSQRPSGSRRALIRPGGFGTG